MTEREGEQAERPDAATGQDEDPEPDWAAEIRRQRRVRGERLRTVFSTFDQEQEER